MYLLSTVLVLAVKPFWSCKLISPSLHDPFFLMVAADLRVVMQKYKARFQFSGSFRGLDYLEDKE
jgi:hypothetical protein